MNAIRVLMVLLACLFLGGFVLAATDPAPGEETVTGTVVSSGNLSVVVDADDGRRITLVLDGATMLPLGRPAVGASVVVRYRELDSTRSQALMVTPFESAPVTPPSPSQASSIPPDGDEELAAFAGLESPRTIAALAALAALCLLGASLRLLRDA